MQFRLPIALEAISKGYEVHLACELTGATKTLGGNGIIIHEIPQSRGMNGIAKELAVFRRMSEIVRAIKPDLLHAITAKPIIYGGIVARLNKVPCLLLAISGLGSIFIAEGRKASIFRKLLILGYRSAFKHHNFTAIFQNESDKSLMVDMAGLRPQNSIIINGSGVRYPTVLFCTRAHGDCYRRNGSPTYKR